VGHRHIKENQIGLEVPSFLDGIFAIDSFADLEISLGEKLGQNAASGGYRQRLESAWMSS
jgi:hypothetical protein